MKHEDALVSCLPKGFGRYGNRYKDKENAKNDRMLCATKPVHQFHLFTSSSN